MSLTNIIDDISGNVLSKFEVNIYDKWIRVGGLAELALENETTAPLDRSSAKSVP